MKIPAVGLTASWILVAERLSRNKHAAISMPESAEESTCPHSWYDRNLWRLRNRAQLRWRVLSCFTLKQFQTKKQRYKELSRTFSQISQNAVADIAEIQTFRMNGSIYSPLAILGGRAPARRCEKNTHPSVIAVHNLECGLPGHKPTSMSVDFEETWKRSFRIRKWMSMFMGVISCVYVCVCVLRRQINKSSKSCIFQIFLWNVGDMVSSQDVE